MIAIRPGFFYTRTVPCELWFLDKDKPKERRNKILMIDARNIYRRVTRRIYDFSPEQQKNLSAIVWLYRGQTDRFVALVADHFECMVGALGEAVQPLSRLSSAFADETKTLDDENIPDHLAEVVEDLKTVEATFSDDAAGFQSSVTEIINVWRLTNRDNDSLKAFAEISDLLADECGKLNRQADHLYKLLSRVADVTKSNGRGNLLNSLDEARRDAVEQLRLPRYFRRQAGWLQERFPDAKLCNVEGLVRLIDQDELEGNDWSLTPGRYVGVAPDEEGEDFDFEEVLRSIHIDLNGLNDEAIELAARIDRQFEELGV